MQYLHLRFTINNLVTLDIFVINVYIMHLYRPVSSTDTFLISKKNSPLMLFPTICNRFLCGRLFLIITSSVYWIVFHVLFSPFLSSAISEPMSLLSYDAPLDGPNQSALVAFNLYFKTIVWPGDASINLVLQPETKHN